MSDMENNKSEITEKKQTEEQGRKTVTGSRPVKKLKGISSSKKKKDDGMSSLDRMELLSSR